MHQHAIKRTHYPHTRRRTLLFLLTVIVQKHKWTQREKNIFCAHVAESENKIRAPQVYCCAK
jgi:hypothetical protein